MIIYLSARESEQERDLENDTEKRRRTTVNSENEF